VLKRALLRLRRSFMESVCHDHPLFRKFDRLAAKKSQYLPERQQQDSHNLCCYAKTTQAVVAKKGTMT
jgi:hypothetical protein